VDDAGKVAELVGNNFRVRQAQDRCADRLGQGMYQ
jgi:hypothetical protein